MAAVLGICLLFKTIVSSYCQSNNTHLILRSCYSRKKRWNHAFKSFIHLYHWGRYFCRTEQAERKRIFKQLRDFTVKEITFFDRNLCWTDTCINLWLTFCVPVSFGEMFIKHAQIQSYWYLWYYVNKRRLEFYSSNFTQAALSKNVCVFLQFWFPNQFLGQFSIRNWCNLFGN